MLLGLGLRYLANAVITHRIITTVIALPHHFRDLSTVTLHLEVCGLCLSDVAKDQAAELKQNWDTVEEDEEEYLEKKQMLVDP